MGFRCHTDRGLTCCAVMPAPKGKIDCGEQSLSKPSLGWSQSRPCPAPHHTLLSTFLPLPLAVSLASQKSCEILEVMERGGGIQHSSATVFGGTPMSDGT